MKLKHEVLKVENCGDFLRVTVQGKALRDAEWRPMLSCVVDVPDTIKNRQAFYVGRRVQIQLTAL